MPSTCSPNFIEDCADADPTRFYLATLRRDADGDQRCQSGQTIACIGNVPPSGLRFPNQCLGDDCNDADGSLYQLLGTRVDADRDGFCVGPVTNVCSGANPPAGYVLPQACDQFSDDCKDTNPQATRSCTIIAGYVTQSAVKACAFRPPTEMFTVSSTQLCPFNFVMTSHSAVRTAGTGSCSATSPTSISMTCNGLDGATCHIEGTCTAL